MEKQLTWGKAIQTVLASSATPLHYSEITKRIIDEGLRQDLGATPAATVAAQLSASTKHEGTSSPYRRVGKGIYTMANKVVDVSAPEIENSTTDSTGPDDTEPQYAVVTSFGMFWRRELVEWSRNPKLLGRQPKATSVDFGQQYGIYLLYDDREVIYVGRATDRALGIRLFDHTTDRLAARWNRFSWFGLRPVSNIGVLGNQPVTYDGRAIIPAMEAILIEAVEPRQNRKRGDDLDTVEYIQVEDPNIARRRLAKGIAEELDRSVG